MSTSQSVLGVSGTCWVGFGNPAQFKRPFFAGYRRVCWVCWVWRRVRACVTLFMSVKAQLFFLHARTYKPDQPNTPNTILFNSLFLKGFKCVGSVLGGVFCVSGSVFERKGQ
ncbi:hypothetical protein ALP06_200305 [Pseudomonas coronafaciens pv. atropurpurea]|nr:hypothetical protein ALP06_200305 [Pseudomonas coronafaciens pv. atropurpurea]